MANILDILVGPIVSAVNDWRQSKADQKKLETQVTSALNEKKLEIISKSEDYAQAFRLVQLEKASWRPGYWTVVLSIPVVMCFVPGLVPYAQAGFAALNTLPSWFQYFLGIAVTSAFGYQVADKAYEWWKMP